MTARTCWMRRRCEAAESSNPPEPVDVVVTVRWSDLHTEQLHGQATHWVYPYDGAPAVVHCRLDGSRFMGQLLTWFPAADVRRANNSTIASADNR